MTLKAVHDIYQEALRITGVHQSEAAGFVTLAYCILQLNETIKGGLDANSKKTMGESEISKAPLPREL